MKDLHAQWHMQTEIVSKMELCRKSRESHNQGNVCRMAKSVFASRML
jgi:hypothetical protein